MSRGHARSGPARHRRPRTRSAGLLIAAGTVVSRATGFVRAAIVLAALGSGLLADGYNVANTVPNILFVLLIGGALNTVLVPHLVTAQQDTDGGLSYTNRLLTALATTLLAVTAAATATAPWVVDAYTSYTGAQHSLTVAFAYLCLPQIFFYGMFTVVGQVLNARNRFGPMAWAPVLSNMVVIAVFAAYIVISGEVRDAGDMTTRQITLLGAGTTLGIAVQALALLPFLRATGIRWRPRFDWHGTGLGAPLRMAGWTVLMVLTDQISYWVVTRLSTQAGQHAEAAGLSYGVGYTTYSNAYLLWVVPHGVITVSLVTALMPRMSSAGAERDMPLLRAQLSQALRSSAVFTLPATFGFLALAPQLTAVAFGHGRTSPGDVHAIAWTLMAFAPGLVCYSAQYTLSRAFYALHDSRTPFFLNLVVFTVNTAGSVASYLLLPTRWAVVGMAASFALAFAVGLTATAVVLRRRLGGLDARQVLRTHARLALGSALAAGAAYGIARTGERAVGDGFAGALLGLAVGAVPLAALILVQRVRR
ncbi:murein biosynthesis integral membrane protein MurJ [Streptomyces olivoreticuli]